MSETIPSVCVDASVVVKLLVDEDDSPRAHALWRAWAAAELRPVAPGLLVFECTSVLRRRVARGDLGERAGRRALDRLLELPISFPALDGLVEAAWQLRTG